MDGVEDVGTPTLDEAVRQYLVYRDYRKAAAALEAEAPGLADQPVSRAGALSPAAARIAERLGGAMDLGDGEAFFESWQEHLERAGASDDDDCMKLEFYLQIYFAVFPVVHGDGSAAAGAMARFRQFLETRGAALAQTTEFLPYYALPFVGNLREHPSFESLFATNWTVDLRRQLEGLLDRTAPGSVPPALTAAWAGYNGEPATSIPSAAPAAAAAAAEAKADALVHRLSDAENRGQALLEEHCALQRNYHTLIGTAAELVEALESSIRGVAVKPEYLMKIVAQLNGFSSVTQSQMMRRVVHERRSVSPAAAPTAAAAAVEPSPSPAKLRASAEPRAASRANAGTHPNVARRSLAQSMEHAPLPQLDDTKIRKHLLSLTDRNAAVLLQALRWRVTRCRVGAQRKAVLDDFAICDYLGANQPEVGPVYSLIQSGSIEVREYATRLLNCLASTAKGREYMLVRNLVHALMGQMMAEEGDTMVRQNILGTLQKLSLRRKAQTFLIEKGAIAWLHGALQARDQLCEYSEEYAAALLMNLCLRTAGRRFCETECPDVLELLRDLLAHESDQVRTYVHGALFRLLGSQILRKRAAELGFEAAIQDRIQNSTEEMATQLDYILNQLTSSEFEPDEDDGGDDDDDDDDDDIEDEGDDLAECDAAEGETVVAPIGVSSGEQLLCSEYLRHRRRQPDAAQPHDVRKPPGSRGGVGSVAGPAAQLVRDSPVLVRPVTPVVRTTSRLGSARSQRPSSHRGGGSRPASGARPPSGHNDAAALRSALVSQHRGSRAGSRPRSSRPPSARAVSATGARSHGPSRVGTASRGGVSRLSVTPRPGTQEDGQQTPGQSPARSPSAAASPVSPTEPRAPPPPSDKVLAAVSKKMGGDATEMVGEYNNIFTTRPKVPRTPGPQ